MLPVYYLNVKNCRFLKIYRKRKKSKKPGFYSGSAGNLDFWGRISNEIAEKEKNSLF
jgi:hypothetical protein